MIMILYLIIAFLVWIILYISKIKKYKKENFETLSFSSYYDKFKYEIIFYSLCWIILIPVLLAYIIYCLITKLIRKIYNV